MQRFLVFFFCSWLLCVADAQSQSWLQSVEEVSRPASAAVIQGDSFNGLREVIVSTGDSLTVGDGEGNTDDDPFCTGATADGCFCQGCYVPRLAALSGIPTINKGYGGDTSWNGASKIDSFLETYKPQVLTIYYGNNDAGNSTTEEVISNLSYMIDRCLSYGTLPVIATLGPQLGAWEYRQPYILDINQGIRQLAAAKGIPLADVAVPLWNNPYGYILPDGIHPNIAGHTVIADLFFQAINQCAYGLSPLSENFRHSGGTGSVSVTTGTGSVCTWMAVSNADWIEMTGGSSGVGSGTVTYRVAFNNTGRERTGTLTIAGKTFTVTQKKAPVLNFLPLLLDE